MSLHLQSNSIYTNQLNTDNFARMLKDPSQCYKFYWLEAILTLMETTDGDLSFDSIINEMICAAWYLVVNYHLHLGPTIRGKSENFLEHAIRCLISSSMARGWRRRIGRVLSGCGEKFFAETLNSPLMQFELTAIQ